MIRIGIDFSLNSPSVCIDTGDEIKFISFFNTEGCDWNRPNPLKKFKTHNDISNVIELCPYERHKKEKDWTYAKEQSMKMFDAEMMSELIISVLDKHNVLNGDVKISLEGFAYSSAGAAFIDLILFNSFLRKDLIKRIGSENIEIIAPSTAKKLAGKGNADKEFMVNAFINNVLNDDKLANTALHKYLVSNEPDMKNIKPVDDLVDSYFIMKSQTK